MIDLVSFTILLFKKGRQKKTSTKHSWHSTRKLYIKLDTIFLLSSTTLTWHPICECYKKVDKCYDEKFDNTYLASYVRNAWKILVDFVVLHLAAVAAAAAVVLGAVRVLVAGLDLEQKFENNENNENLFWKNKFFIL